MLAALATVAAPGGARAEIVSNVEHLTNSQYVLPFFRSDAYIRALATNAAQFDRTLGFECDDDSYNVTVTGIDIDTPIEMGRDDIRPTAGQWLTRYEATRCGETATYNAVGQIGEDGAVQSIPLVPGETGFGIVQLVQLQRVIAQLSQIEGCTAVMVRNTQLGVPAGMAQGTANARYETWSVEGCGQQRRLILRAERTPDGRTNVQVEQRLSQF